MISADKRSPAIRATVIAMVLALPNFIGSEPAIAQGSSPRDDAASESTTASARVLQRLSLPRGATDVAWSPDGTLLATVGGLEQQIMLWGARSGKLLWERSGHFAGEQALVFSNDGKQLLVSGAGSAVQDEDTALTIWEVATGTIAGRVTGPFPGEGAIANSARTMAVDRERNLLAIVAFQRPGRPVAIYNMRDWTLKGTVKVDEDTPARIAFGRDGTLAVGTVGGSIALFDAQTQNVKRVIRIRHFVHSLAFSPDAALVAGGFGYTADAIRVWSVSGGTLVGAYNAARSAAIESLAWSPDARHLALATSDRLVRLVPVSAADRADLSSFDIEASVVAFSPDGALLAAAGNGGAIIVQIN